MKKKVILLLAITLVCVLALFALTACNSNKTEVGKDILASLNGDFEYDTISSGMTISYWHSTLANGSIAIQPTRSSDKELDDFDFGEGYLALKSQGDFNYVYQTIEVDKKAVYKVTVDVRISGNISTNDGAYITFKENLDYKFIKATSATKYGEWQQETFYVRPKNMNNLTICLCINTGSQTEAITAFYDNITFTKVNASAVPEGTKVTDIVQTKDSATYNSTATGIAFIVVLSVLSLCILYAAYIIIKRLYSKQDCFVSIEDTASTKKNTSKASDFFKNPWTIACILMLGAFAVRLILLLTTYGMGSNMSALLNIGYNTRKTSALINAYGTGGVVTNSSVPNMAPGSLYILAILMNIVDPSINPFGASVLVRLVEVFADMAIVGMIYFFGKKYVGNKLSTVYAGLYALLPVTFVMSGYVGSFECMVIALTLAAVILMLEKQYIPMFVVITLAAVLNVEALAVAPIMVAYLAYQWYRDDKELKKVTKTRIILPVGLVLSIVLAYLLVLPFTIVNIKAAPFGGFTVMVNELSNNAIFVNNAFNLYSMVGMNMTTANSTASILNLVFLLILEVYVVSLYIHNKNKMEILLLCSFVFAVIAVFTLKITFTYLILAIAFGLIYTMISGDRRMYFIIGAYSILLFLNIAQLTNLSGLFVQNQAIGSNPAAYTNIDVASYYELDAFLIVFSIFAVLVTLYYFYVSYNITNSEKIKDIKPLSVPYTTYLKTTFKNLGTSIKGIFTKKADKE